MCLSRPNLRVRIIVVNAISTSKTHLTESRGVTLLEIIAVLVLVTIFVALIVPPLFKARDRAKITACASNLKQIGMALVMYADGPGNRLFPTCSKTKDPYADDTPMQALNLLFSTYLPDRKVFSCPLNPVEPDLLNAVTELGPQRRVISGTAPMSHVSCSYAYDPGHSPDDATTIFAADKKGAGRNSDNHGPNAGQNILLGAGTVVLNEDLDKSMLQDNNIYSLNTELPRNVDSYLRQ